MNVRVVDQNSVGLSFGEAINKEDITALLSAFGVKNAEEKFTTSNLLSIEIIFHNYYFVYIIFFLMICCNLIHYICVSGREIYFVRVYSVCPAAYVAVPDPP